MRNNIYKTSKEDEIRRWTLQGKAEISDIIRKAENNLEFLVLEIEKYLANQLHLADVKIYQKDGKKFTRPIIIETQIHITQHEQSIIHSTETTKKTIENINHITHFIQTQTPETLSYPINSGTILLGIITLLPSEQISKKQQAYLSDLSEIIGKAWHSILLNHRNSRLLAEQQILTTQLLIQKATLQQKTEEMSRAELEILEANQHITSQFQELQQTQKRIQVLMENSTEIVTIYNKDGSIRYVSPSVEKILGYTLDELIDIDDIKFTVPSKP
jgi:hypothetical protein